MPPRRLSAEDQALWLRVAATVTPLARRAKKQVAAASAELIAAPAAPPPPGPRRPAPLAPAAPMVARADPRKPIAPPADTLDGGWDRRIQRGAIQPDRTIDLHGHTLATAHSALEHALARAISDEVRVLLVVTGKPPRGDAQRRGLIRANIGNWLAGSAYAGRIAAVRNAHPRHGGAGALYLVLRRKRGG